MNIVVGKGSNRKVVTIGHRATMTRGERDRIREDLKAFIVRPATFVGHSRTSAARVKKWSNM